VDEAVSDGQSGGGVMEELAPFFEDQVGGDDGGASLVAPIEDLVQQICAAGIESEVTKFIDLCGAAHNATSWGSLPPPIGS
jgi:hypothetical protein